MSLDFLCFQFLPEQMKLLQKEIEQLYDLTSDKLGFQTVLRCIQSITQFQFSCRKHKLCLTNILMKVFFSDFYIF